MGRKDICFNCFVVLLIKKILLQCAATKQLFNKKKSHFLQLLEKGEKSNSYNNRMRCIMNFRKNQPLEGENGSVRKGLHSTGKGKMPLGAPKPLYFLLKKPSFCVLHFICFKGYFDYSQHSILQQKCHYSHLGNLPSAKVSPIGTNSNHPSLHLNLPW